MEFILSPANNNSPGLTDIREIVFRDSFDVLAGAVTEVDMTCTGFYDVN